MIINNNAGHTLKGLGTGSIGYLNESYEVRNVSKHFVDNMKSLGHIIYDCTVDQSNNYLSDIVSKANKRKSDLAISHHMNHVGYESGNGVEVWIYDLDDEVAYNYANRICEEIAKLGFKNRGVKENKDFYWLKYTKDRAMIIEYLFVSNRKDTQLYNAKKLADAVTNALVGKLPTTTLPTLNSYKNGDYNKSAVVVNTNGTGLNIRSERNSKSKILGKFNEGQVITVNYCLDNWFSTYSNGQLGFIYGAYVELL